MDLNKQLMEDLKKAMLGHDKRAMSVIRMLKSALTNEKIKLGHDLKPDEINTVVSRQMKQNKESIEEFKKGHRDDLVKEQEAQLKILSKYAPKQLSEDEIKKIVSDTADQVGASSMKDFGKMMGAVMPKVKGHADGSVVNRIVKAQLN
ncbi:hypothetical protein WR164_08920 [Philodulcilactobacillus myokoensis]|uniref:GatB/YqeY domain-containing protein n=1 Tax=Philodulcilactobacillus myokoensis TaxID=2929573 RepID=A0A9W6ET15_9LACO|nr:GatB/YqeY domain-containing protein [Philodulcilactobacillus myokoensis]GLB46913.1 hypothetical protein WR164_08920 [Philodulcilactobacillus myokoensis]